MLVRIRGLLYGFELSADKTSNSRQSATNNSLSDKNARGMRKLMASLKRKRKRKTLRNVIRTKKSLLEN